MTTRQKVVLSLVRWVMFVGLLVCVWELGGDLLALSFLAPLREELSVSRPLHGG